MATSCTVKPNAKRGITYTYGYEDGRKTEVAGVDIVCMLAQATTETFTNMLHHLSPPTNNEAERTLHSTEFSSEPKYQQALLQPMPQRYHPSTSICKHLSAVASKNTSRTTTFSSVDYTNDPMLTIIISTQAGSQRAVSLYVKTVLPLLSKLKVTPANPKVRIHYSNSATSISEACSSLIVEPARDGRANLVILLSGDGGVIDIVDAVHTCISPTPQPPKFRPPMIALLPCGTGNALAHSAGITRDKTEGLSTLMRGAPKPLPVFRVTLPKGSFGLDSQGQPVSVPAISSMTIYGAVVFSWALHSTLVADSDSPEYRKHGASRFQMAGKELLSPGNGEAMHAWKGRLSYLPVSHKNNATGDWLQVSSQEHAYVLATLVSNLEEKFCVSPASLPLDGVMRLVHFAVPTNGGAGVMDLMSAAYDGGKHVKDKRVGYEPVQGVRLVIEEEDEKWRRVCVDGKIFVVPKDSVVECVRETKKGVELLAL